MKHEFYTEKDVDETSDEIAYFIVEMGLDVCKVCGGAESSLATECPGEKITYEQRKAIHLSEIDFKNGCWVRG